MFLYHARVPRHPSPEPNVYCPYRLLPLRHWKRCCCGDGGGVVDDDDAPHHDDPDETKLLGACNRGQRHAPVDPGLPQDDTEHSNTESGATMVDSNRETAVHLDGGYVGVTEDSAKDRRRSLNKSLRWDHEQPVVSADRVALAVACVGRRSRKRMMTDHQIWIDCCSQPCTSISRRDPTPTVFLLELLEPATTRWTIPAPETRVLYDPA